MTSGNPNLDALQPGISVARAERVLRDVLVAADVEGAETAARLILMRATGLDRTGLIIAAGRAITRAEQAGLLDMAGRRLKREPLQRVLGDAEFWGLTLRLSAATLIPRADTETLVEAALKAFPDPALAFTFADLGTGSGAILAAILSERPNAFGIGLDIAEDALQTAAGNLGRLKLAERSRLYLASFAEPLPARALDLIVSNPPYIETTRIPRLAPEVARHEPLLALDGGPDGLAAYRVLIPHARAALKPGGRIMLEIGHDQSETVSILLDDNGFTDIRILPDLAGIGRVASAIQVPVSAP